MFEGIKNIFSIDGQGTLHEDILPFRGAECYSFRNNRTGEDQTKFQTIRICPRSVYNEIGGGLQNDVSFRMLAKKTEGNPFQDFLNSIPAIQIREYVQSPRLEQLANAFSFVKRGYDFYKLTRESDNGFWKSLMETAKTAFESLNVTSGLDGVIDKGIKIAGPAGDAHKKYIFDLVFLMYYGIMSSKTKHYYTLPYNGKIIDSSDGAAGWSTEHGIANAQTTSFGALGHILNFVGASVRINTTPLWTGSTQTSFPEIQVQFELFNDDVDGAVQNFLFLNTIFPMNRFIQYHIFQYNPAVYDIKIEGFNRFYMCSAKMQCDYKGVAREPSEKFLRSLKRFINPYYGNIFHDIGKIRENKLIKIPDVYTFTLTFTSLLPNSMNNYLYQYSGNMNMENGWKEPFNGLSETVINNLEEQIAKAIPQYKEQNEQTGGNNNGATGETK